jgi:hypothetical protein
MLAILHPQEKLELHPLNKLEFQVVIVLIE